MLQLRITFKSLESHSCLVYITWVRDQFWFIVGCFCINLSSDLAVEVKNNGFFLRGFLFLCMESICIYSSLPWPYKKPLT